MLKLQFFIIVIERNQFLYYMTVFSFLSYSRDILEVQAVFHSEELLPWFHHCKSSVLIQTETALTAPTAHTPNHKYFKQLQWKK